MYIIHIKMNTTDSILNGLENVMVTISEQLKGPMREVGFYRRVCVCEGFLSCLLFCVIHKEKDMGFF
jgi:hypothetical protein